jgi:hypothetical protein
MSDSTRDPEPTFRMMLQSRGPGRYGFIISRSGSSDRYSAVGASPFKELPLISSRNLPVET